ncbi:MAG: hypothetical protein WC593_15110 [Methanoregula sp.]
MPDKGVTIIVTAYPDGKIGVDHPPLKTPEAMAFYASILADGIKVLLMQGVMERSDDQAPQS